MDKKEEIKELTREERLLIEEKAIEALLEMGVKFSVPLKLVPRKAPWFIRWWNAHFPNHLKIWKDRRIPQDWDVEVEDIPDVHKRGMIKVYMRNFYIKPLYLGTIDYIRKLYLRIEYDEALFQQHPIEESKKLFKYIQTVAEIAAAAVINDKSIVNNPKKLKELKDFFIENLTVVRLQKLAAVISNMMNSGGFTSSIRLIGEIGTTKKAEADLVE